MPERYRTFLLRHLDLTPRDLHVSRHAAEAIAGKRVLVTGAGGSIGSELCRQVHGFGPAELIMLDHDESNLHRLQLELYGEEGSLFVPDPNFFGGQVAYTKQGEAVKKLPIRSSASRRGHRELSVTSSARIPEQSRTSGIAPPDVGRATHDPPSKRSPTT
jgi:hypothetical protein